MNTPHGRPSDENPAEMYERYFVPAMFVPGAQVLLDRAGPQPGEHVLDVACGTGVVARHVAPKVGATGAVTALDINPAMLAVARSTSAIEGQAITWQEGSALALPFGDATFNLVLCQQGLQFFPDRVAAMREMRRVLQEGGRVAISVNQSLQNNPVYEALYHAIARHLGMSAVDIASPFALGNADELHALFTAAGFEQVKVAPATFSVRFPEPARFVHLTVLSSSAVLPVFGQMDAAARAELVASVAREMEPVLRSQTEGDTVTFPLAVNIGLAYG